MSDIITQLEDACLASCTCLTKTPDFQYHQPTCRYRVLNEAIGRIEEQGETIANLAKIIANHVATAEEDRRRIRDAEEDLRNYRTSAEAEIAQLRKPAAVQVMQRYNFDRDKGRIVRDGLDIGAPQNWALYSACEADAEIARLRQRIAELEKATDIATQINNEHLAREDGYKADIAGLVHDHNIKDCDIAELRTQAKVNLHSADTFRAAANAWMERYDTDTKKLSDSNQFKQSVIDQQQAELAELRNPVAVDKDSQIELYRQWRRQGEMTEMSVYEAFDYVLSAYDTLAQDCAKYANAHSVLMAERDNLKLQAQCHAQEARTANATIAEIYQACTGATGEPGNWNGAQPVIQMIAAHDVVMAENKGLRERLQDATVIKDLLHTAFSGLKGNFKLPQSWLSRARIALFPEIYQQSTRVSDPPCRSERDGIKCSLERHHDSDHEYDDTGALDELETQKLANEHLREGMQKLPTKVVDVEERERQLREALQLVLKLLSISDVGLSAEQQAQVDAALSQPQEPK